MMHRLAVVPVVVLVLAARVAAADPNDARSPDLGLELSAGGTAASAGLIVGGLVLADQAPSSRDAGYSIALVGLASTLVTPSLGEWYGGRVFTTGLGLRLAAVAVTALGVSQLSICFDECSGTHNNSAAGALIAIGLTSYAVGIGWDIATAPSTVRESNAQRHRLVLTPSIVTTPSGGAAYGLGVDGKF
jgi:hypothetical protein